MTTFGFCAALIMKEQQVLGHPSNLKGGFFPILFGKITQQEFYHLPPKCKTLLPKQNPGGAWRHPDKQLIRMNI